MAQNVNLEGGKMVLRIRQAIFAPGITWIPGQHLQRDWIHLCWILTLVIYFNNEYRKSNEQSSVVAEPSNAYKHTTIDRRVNPNWDVDRSAWVSLGLLHHPQTKVSGPLKKLCWENPVDGCAIFTYCVVHSLLSLFNSICMTNPAPFVVIDWLYDLVVFERIRGYGVDNGPSCWWRFRMEHGTWTWMRLLSWVYELEGSSMLSSNGEERRGRYRRSFCSNPIRRRPCLSPYR